MFQLLIRACLMHVGKQAEVFIKSVYFEYQSKQERLFSGSSGQQRVFIQTLILATYLRHRKIFFFVEKPRRKHDKTPV